MGSKVAFWRRHLVAWRDSGLSQAAYCRQHEVSLSSFGYRRGKWDAVPSPPALLPLVVSPVSPSVDRIEVTLPNGLQVRLPIDGDATPWVPMIRAPSKGTGVVKSDRKLDLTTPVPFSHVPFSHPLFYSDKPMTLRPVEDAAHLDERRAAVGLPPMADYRCLMGATYGKGT
jgi:hypothetical protein